MTRKFERNFRAIIQVSDVDADVVIIEPPFTVQFDITRNTLSSANVAQFRFYNLKREIRDRIRKNVYDFDVFRAVSFAAGYRDDLAVVFTGTVSQAWTVREGVDMVTQVECFDGGYAFVNGVTNRSFPSGTRQDAMVRKIFDDLPRIEPGVISANDSKNVRATVYSGNTKDILDDITAGGFFVDNGVANVLRNDEFISGAPVVISPESGLLGTPTLENNIAHFDLLFEPNMSIGQPVKVVSFTEKAFNGLYVITAVKHRGIISGAVAGSVVTTGQFFYDQALRPVSKIG